jgi:phenylpropionate dioxygenase-like ring-hydroxylating dioxygenase large terminal subunit
VQGLPAGWYSTGSRSEHEFDAVFAASWQFVCHASDLPASGTAARFDCGGRSAIVLRTRAGGLQGFRNVCRHRGARLVEGDPHTGLAFCVDGRLRCPNHGWAYDEAGALVAVPEGQDFGQFDMAAHALHRVEVAEWRGLVFVAFGRPSRPPGHDATVAAPAWPDLAPLRRLAEPRLTPVAADWKLACEHLLDLTHRDVARPQSLPQVFEPARFAASSGTAIHATVGLAADAAADAWSSRTYRRLLRGRPAAAARAEILFLWPNLLLQLAPDALSVTQVLPRATGSCWLRESRYGAADSSREMRLLRYAHERVKRQARAGALRLLERAQAGQVNLAADESGPLALAETGVRWFTALCRERCATGPAVVPRRAPRRTPR